MKITRDGLVLTLAAALLIQSGLVLDLAIAARRNKFEADKYADISTYYVSVLQREEIELEDYDLIALSTMYNDGRE